MERAAARCASWLLQHFPYSSFKIFVGPGNNGGDGLVIARHLAQKNKKVAVYLVNEQQQRVSGLHAINLQRLREMGGVPCVDINSAAGFPSIERDDLVVDALFGSGLKRPLAGLYKELIRYLNRWPETGVSVDIPSGLMGEDNTENDREAIFCADHTLTFEFPFLSFFFAENEPYVGQWHVLSIGLHPVIIRQMATPFFLTELSDIVLPERKRFSHKGNYGHALLVAGSKGMMGAAVLAAEACLLSGAGLLTVHVPACGYEIIQTAVPEAMANVDPDGEKVTTLPSFDRYHAVGAGCGLGRHPSTAHALKHLVLSCKLPLVLDADALNLLAGNPEMLAGLPAGTVLTPHPGEFDRLFGPSENGYRRMLKQRQMAQQYKVVIVLKGAFSSVALPGGEVYFNPTGNPGMATGGSGDVLTGIILGFLAQGHEPSKAAIMATCLHGLAGDIAMEDKAQENIVARDIIHYLGKAFLKVKKLNPENGNRQFF